MNINIRSRMMRCKVMTITTNDHHITIATFKWIKFLDDRIDDAYPAPYFLSSSNWNWGLLDENRKRSLSDCVELLFGRKGLKNFAWSTNTFNINTNNHSHNTTIDRKHWPLVLGIRIGNEYDWVECGVKSEEYLFVCCNENVEWQNDKMTNANRQ